jgi:hypothetical protein
MKGEQNVHNQYSVTKPRTFAGDGQGLEHQLTLGCQLTDLESNINMFVKQC